MVTLHGKEIKVGDKVWNVECGWEEITHIDDKANCESDFIISTTKDCYRTDGKKWACSLYPTIYPTEMILTPKPQPVYEWQWLFLDKVNGLWNTTDYYKTAADAVKEFYCADTPDELVLIEQSKREVK